MITNEKVLKAQEKWAKAIIEIGTLASDRDKLEERTREIVNELYAFNNGNVLFKPTKASIKQFRLTFDAAISYFIGGNQDYSEDQGFGLKPWVNVKFYNADIVLTDNKAFAMGNYFFTDPDGDTIKVEYTFGYVEDNNQDLKIFIHHSSVPYSG